MIEKEEVLRIGKLHKSHGIKGEIALVLDKPAYADVDAEFYFLEIDGIFVPFLIEEVALVTDTAARVKFADVDDEIQASRLANRNVFVLREHVVSHSDDGVSNWDFFIGYSVLDQCSGDLGTIESVDSATINILFVVKKGETEHLIPAAEDFIVEVNSEKKIICMDLPEGLIE